MCYDYYSNLTYYLLQIDLDGDLNEWKKEKKVNNKTIINTPSSYG